MPIPLPDYYAIMDLGPAATQAEIKQRYRELARRFHPDVNPSPDAAQKIKTVNEAHRILGDPDRRSRYDAERILNPVFPSTQRQTDDSPRSAADRQRQPSRPFVRNPAPPPSQTRQQRTAPRVEFNGFGRVTPESAEQKRTKAPVQQTQTRSPKQDSAAAGRLVSEAQIALLTRNYSDADRLCREALSKDRTAAGAHEVLGDVYAIRGDTESAIKAYSYAIQYNPRNYSAQGKLDRLIGKKPFATPGPLINRKTAGPAFKPGVKRASREIALALISVGLFASGCAAVAVFCQNPGVPLGGAIPWITSLSPNLMIALTIEGIISGMLLAFYGRLWPISNEFSSAAHASGSGRTGRKAPLLVILTLFSFVWFYASLLVYIGVAFGRNRTSVSMVRVYSLVLVLVALFTAMAVVNDRGGWLETAAFAGNILFPGALFGWYLGDRVRLRSNG
jgi:curved DNA-binding protein CbpA